MFFGLSGLLIYYYHYISSSSSTVLLFNLLLLSVDVELCSQTMNRSTHVAAAHRRTTFTTALTAAGSSKGVAIPSLSPLQVAASAIALDVWPLCP